MKIIYIADDGTQFNDKYECEEYEWISNHPNIRNVKMYDKNDNELTTYMSQDTYENADVVIVPDDEALDDLHELAEFTGFSYYFQVACPGRWEFRMNGFNGCYVRVGQV